MFGRRNDAINVGKKLDPIVLFTPLIMPTRCESMIQVTIRAEYEPIAAYIRQKNSAGQAMSFVSVLAAAYVRTVAHCPMMNYFVVGKKVFSHKDISISLIVLRDMPDGSSQEEEVKIVCQKEDTIYQVADNFEAQIAEAKKPGAANGTSDFAGTLLRIPLLPSLVVALGRLADRLGILPRALTKISPFHCSLFLTNMMSIGLPSIYHHLYNFGTCSVFLSIGRPERHTTTVGGKLTRTMTLPLGLTSDERICGGAEFAKAIHRFNRYLRHPEILEMSLAEEKALEAKTGTSAEVKSVF